MSLSNEGGDNLRGGCGSTCRRPSALEHGSDRHETLPKRVSDDPRQFNFRRKNKIRQHFLVSIHLFRLFEPILEAGQANGSNNRIPRNFCSECTYYELCMTHNQSKYLRLRLRHVDAAPSCFRRPPFCLTVIPTLIEKRRKKMEKNN